MEERKEQIKDIVPDIRMTDVLNGNFFRTHYPLEDSEFDDIAMPDKDKKHV